jgi:transposase
MEPGTEWDQFVDQEETVMDATTIGVDLAKHQFEIALDGARGPRRRQRLTRGQFTTLLRTHAPAELVMEACATAHYWGRLAQQHGHRVTLLPPQYVTPFVRRQKTDRTDVDGILDAHRSAGLTRVPVKTLAQQEVAALHRLRQQWMTTRTARVNALRGLLAEFGVLLPAGVRRVCAAAVAVLDQPTAGLPDRVRRVLRTLVEEIRSLEDRVTACERELKALAAADPVLERLQTIPGVGLVSATAFVGAVGHIGGFTRGRRFASWLGLTPREHSSGSRRQLGAITKQGDRYLRSLLTHGARAVLFAARRAARAHRPLSRLQQWALAVLDRRGPNRATIALANKLARIIWAVWTRDVPYSAQPAIA